LDTCSFHDIQHRGPKYTIGIAPEEKIASFDQTSLIIANKKSVASLRQQTVLPYQLRLVFKQ
jgi:hypothetical protein